MKRYKKWILFFVFVSAILVYLNFHAGNIKINVTEEEIGMIAQGYEALVERNIFHVMTEGIIAYHNYNDNDFLSDGTYKFVVLIWKNDGQKYEELKTVGKYYRATLLDAMRGMYSLWFTISDYDIYYQDIHIHMHSYNNGTNDKIVQRVIQECINAIDMEE